MGGCGGSGSEGNGWRLMGGEWRLALLDRDDEGMRCLRVWDDWYGMSE